MKYKLYVHIACILIMIEIFFKNTFHEFIQFIFNVVLQKLITNIVSDDRFLTYVIGALISWLAGLHLFKRDKDDNKK